MSASENTPLLRQEGETKRSLGARLWAMTTHIENRILFTGFLITLCFSYTQVPIFYVFHLMECDVYYSTHPPYEGTGDRCSINEITAGTATQFSILGMSTTLFGTMNLFVAGWTVKKIGPKLALMVQTLVAAIRVSTQVLGVLAGGRSGIVIFQLTQTITIIGGPVGYILIINIIAGELVEPMRRTAVFGMLQGCLMLGQGLGYLAGGMIGDWFGIRRPFEVACVSFLLATLFVFLTMPTISPEKMSDGKKKVKGIAGFFAPLKVLAPQKLLSDNGSVRKHYGVLFLCFGVFLGVVATSYAPLLYQMYATASFGFTQGDNAYLMSGYAFMRAFFLIFLFPSLIDYGRKWYVSRSSSTDGKKDAVFPTPGQIEAPMGTQAEEEPVQVRPAEDKEACHFDLFFLRWSLLVDGILTTGAAFATQGWHIYLSAFLLPFGSGSAPAAKGVITEMCPSSQRADALNALTLVENIARLTTQGLFGFIFGSLAEAGQAYLTFFVNAAIALIAMGVLLLSHFPPDDTRLLDDDAEDVSSEETVVDDNDHESHD